VWLGLVRFGTVRWGKAVKVGCGTVRLGSLGLAVRVRLGLVGYGKVR